MLIVPSSTVSSMTPVVPTIPVNMILFYLILQEVRINPAIVMAERLLQSDWIRKHGKYSDKHHPKEPCRKDFLRSS